MLSETAHSNGQFQVEFIYNLWEREEKERKGRYLKTICKMSVAGTIILLKWFINFLKVHL